MDSFFEVKLVAISIKQMRLQKHENPTPNMARNSGYQRKSAMAKHLHLYLLATILQCVARVVCGDNDAPQDYCVSSSGMTFASGFACDATNSSSFKSSLLAGARGGGGHWRSSVTVASASNFAGLNSQGISFARIEMDKGSMVPFHEHPRASEVVFLSKGTLIVAFIDTNNTFFWETLSEGDVFFFPKGLFHFLVNVGNGPATAFSAFNSQNPGLVSIVNALFTSNSQILEKAVEKSFLMSSKQVHRLRGVVSPASMLLPHSSISLCLFLLGLLLLFSYSP